MMKSEARARANLVASLLIEGHLACPDYEHHENPNADAKIRDQLDKIAQSFFEKWRNWSERQEGDPQVGRDDACPGTD